MSTLVLIGCRLVPCLASFPAVLKEEKESQIITKTLPER